ncbi:MAG: hypothetical protein ABSE27_06895 [Acidobacteriaceae bacterium]
MPKKKQSVLLTDKVSAAYAASGVDIASGSPLLIMAAAKVASGAAPPGTKKKSPPPIPPLSLEVLDAVEKMERYAKSALAQCDTSWNFNREKAMRILRTCVVTTFDQQVKYHKTSPLFHPHWIVDIANSTIASALALNSSTSLDYTVARNELVDTLAEHQAQKEVQEQSDLVVVSEKDDSPAKLFLAYKIEHPEVVRLDICWAAKQHYRDWKRWIKGEFKAGSTPDLAFRKVLKSGKLPSELRKEPRKTGWQ